jgi:hypothetical protein
MAFIITCSECQSRLKTPTAPPIGRAVKCPKCGEQITITSSNVQEVVDGGSKSEGAKSGVLKGGSKSEPTPSKSTPPPPPKTSKPLAKLGDDDEDDAPPKGKSKSRFADDDEDDGYRDDDEPPLPKLKTTKKNLASLDDPDAGDEKPKSKSKSKSRDEEFEDIAPKSKSKRRDDDDDDFSFDDDKPKSKSKRRDDDDDDAAKPKSKSKSRAALDDDDDDLPKSRTKKRGRDDDFDDDDDAPKSKKRGRDDDDDDDFDDEDRPKGKGKGKAKGKKGKKKAGNGMLYLLIGGGVAVIGLAVLLFFLFSGGTDSTMMAMTLEETSSVSYSDFEAIKSANEEAYQSKLKGVSSLAQSVGLEDKDVVAQMSSYGKNGNVTVTKFSKSINVDKFNALGKTATHQDVTYVVAAPPKGNEIRFNSSPFCFVLKDKYFVGTNSEDNIKKLIDNIGKSPRFKETLSERISDVSGSMTWHADVADGRGDDRATGSSRSSNRVTLRFNEYFKTSEAAKKEYDKGMAELDTRKTQMNKMFKDVEISVNHSGTKISGTISFIYESKGKAGGDFFFD